MLGALSYSQCGEDRIVTFLLEGLGHNGLIRYMDLGCANPIEHNNTFLFYSNGSSGVIVEADPVYGGAYAILRPRDTYVPGALVPARLSQGDTAKFYLSNDAGWNSLLPEHVQLGETLGKGPAREVLDVTALTLMSVVDKYVLAGEPIHLLSMDIEGVDLEILSECDFDTFRPWIIVVENQGGFPVHKDLLISKGYVHFATTNVNSIYIERALAQRARF